MEHLFQSWESFSSGYRAAPHVLLLSDYDGTLTPIVGRPEDALLSDGVRRKLSALAQRPGLSVGIISGRSMEETRSLVAIEGIYYAGNHGLEIEGPGLKWVSPQAELTRTLIRDLAGALAKNLGNIAGAIIEDKGLSLSVHYRLVKEEEQKNVADIFKRVILPFADEARVKVTFGKMVYEVRPPIDWDKGKAVESIRREIMSLLELEEVLTIYLGDDTTDEDAFKVLNCPEGWSIYVGHEKAHSAAEFYLNSVAEVEEFLSRLLELK